MCHEHFPKFSFLTPVEVYRIIPNISSGLMIRRTFEGPFATAHTFCASRYDPGESGFLKGREQCLLI